MSKLVKKIFILALLFILSFSHFTYTIYAKKSNNNTNKTSNPGSPIKVGNHEIFRIYEKKANFTPDERADIIGERLEKLLEDDAFSPASLQISHEETYSSINKGDVHIITISDADALPTGIPRQKLAEEYLQKLKITLEKERNHRDVNTLLTGLLFSLLTTWITIYIFRLVGKIFPRIYSWVESLKGSRITAFKIQNLEILSEDKITELLLWGVRVSRVITLILFFYFYSVMVFGFFPQTRDTSLLLLGYIKSILNVVLQRIAGYLPNLAFIMTILVLAYYTNRFAQFIFKEIEKGSIKIPGFYEEWVEPTYQITRFLIIAIALAIILPYLPGAETPAIKGLSIFLGILFSLGSSSVMSNIVSGVILTYMRAFHIGDRVKIGDTVGDVVEKTLLVTRIKTNKNVEITIPNGLLLSSAVHNFSANAHNPGLILHTSITIGYDAPWRQIHQLMIDSALATRHILSDPKPFVLQTALNDFYVEYQINAYTDQPNKMAGIYSELHQNIQDKFNEAGVEIMSSHYMILRDGNQTTIPANYLPPDYQKPTFEITFPEKGQK